MTDTGITIDGYSIVESGGGCSVLCKTMPSGAHVWASDDCGAYPPDEDGWIVCAYADRNQENTLYENSGAGELELRQSVLSAELAIYQHEQGLPHKCALEQLHRDTLTAEQRTWLSSFVRRWEALEAKEEAYAAAERDREATLDAYGKRTDVHLMAPGCIPEAEGEEA